MFENLVQRWIISTFPLWIPWNFKQFVLANQISMYILKVEDICSILGNILYMTLDIVYGPASIGISLNKFLSIYHLIVRLNIWICVNPDIYETIHLLYRIFSLFCVACIVFPCGTFAVLWSEAISVFYRLKHYRLLVMILIMKDLPTQVPVSPSKSHPWKGHCMQVSFTTCPPTPKFAPIWAQYECKP